MAEITLVPPLQADLAEATATLMRPPRNIEALLFSIYRIAVVLLDEDESVGCWDASYRRLHP